MLSKLESDRRERAPTGRNLVKTERLLLLLYPENLFIIPRRIEPMSEGVLRGLCEGSGRSPWPVRRLDVSTVRQHSGGCFPSLHRTNLCIAFRLMVQHVQWFDGSTCRQHWGEGSADADVSFSTVKSVINATDSMVRQFDKQQQDFSPHSYGSTGTG